MVARRSESERTSYAIIYERISPPTVDVFFAILAFPIFVNETIHGEDI